MKYALRIIAALLAIYTPVGVFGAVIFEDGFEPQNMSTTNTDGFAWSVNNATSIVTMNPTCGPPPGTSTVVYNNGVACVNVAGEDWFAKTGDHSLRFRYGAGSNMSEQRFALGKNYPEIWLSYWIRVPVNFTYPSGGSNNKWLALWVGSTGYDQLGDVTWQLRGNGTGANVVYQDGGVLVGEVTGNGNNFISTADRGRWMHVVYQVISASSSTATNGTIRFYRRWDGDTNYTLIHEKLNANTYNPAQATQGISHGYIMGWANSPYPESTSWLLDDFKVATTDLRDVVSQSPGGKMSGGGAISSGGYIR